MSRLRALVARQDTAGYAHRHARGLLPGIQPVSIPFGQPQGTGIPVTCAGDALTWLCGDGTRNPDVLSSRTGGTRAQSARVRSYLPTVMQLSRPVGQVD